MNPLDLFLVGGKDIKIIFKHSLIGQQAVAQLEVVKKSISKSLSFNQQAANLFFSQTCNLHDLTYWHT